MLGKFYSRHCGLLFAVLSFSFPLPSVADDILVGMSTALTGSAEALGKGVKAGVEAKFAEVNAAGGIKGSKLKLVALDDGYEPARTAPNMHSLIDEHKVVAVIGNVGTPTAIVSVPIVNEKKIPLIGAFTGAGVLRNTPPDRYVINYRASYAEETSAMINGFLNDLKIKPEEIAFFTQNDGYGDAGYKGGIQALEKTGFKDGAKLAHGRYARNTENVEEGLGVILDAESAPKAIIMVGAYKACAKFIKLAKAEGINAIFANVSFVGSDALLAELGADAEGIVVTQVVPHYKASMSGIKSYTSSMQGLGLAQEVGFVSLEGYLAASIFTQGLAKIEGAITAESIIDAMEALGEFDLGIGQMAHLSKTNHQAMTQVWPTVVRGGQYIAITDWASLK